MGPFEQTHKQLKVTVCTWSRMLSAGPSIESRAPHTMSRFSPACREEEVGVTAAEN